VASSAEAIRRRRTLVGQVAEAAVFIREHLADSVLTLRLPADEESLFATLLTSRLDRMVEEWVDFWLPFLAEAEERGELRHEVDHRQAAEWIVRMMLSFAVMPAVSFDADQPAQVRAFVRSFIVDGLGPTPEREPPPSTGKPEQSTGKPEQSTGKPEQSTGKPEQPTEKPEKPTKRGHSS
jgi:hypothetical protein